MFKRMQHGLLTSSIQSILEASILGLLALVIYLFTINENTRMYALPLLVGCLLVLLAIYFFDIHFPHNKTDIHQKRTFQILIFACISAILLWVGTTGWFLSPFFYLLYLVAVSLAFLFNSSAAFSFILVLVAILIPQIGSVNTNINIVSLLSLFLIIPLSYFLRREYLARIEREKKILVLESQHKSSETDVESILANKVTNLGAQVREPINDIRQIALYAEKNGAPRDEKDFAKIILSTSRAFEVLNTFEEEVTGRKLVRTPKE